MQTHTTSRRSNRVFKSLHKPLTYLGVERTLFYFVCVGAVGTFNIFNSILAGIAVFIGGYAFGHWVTASDPAFLRILAKSEKYKLRYDAAKQGVPARGGSLMLRLDRDYQAVEGERVSQRPHQPLWVLERDDVPYEVWRSWDGIARPRRGLREP